MGGGWRESWAFQAVGAHMQRGMEVYSSQHIGYWERKASKVGEGQRAGLHIGLHSAEDSEPRANLSQEGLGCQVKD